MSCAGILTAFSSLTLRSLRSTTRNISTNVNPLCFGVTNALLAEPLRKKKRLDPAIVKHREDRRKRKLEKAIKKLEKNARQLKPVSDVEVPFKLVDERHQRLRKMPPISDAIAEERILLEKDWTRYKLKQRMADIQLLDGMRFSQQRALDELKAESEELYQQAIQIDTSLVPVIVEGPKITPPIKNYFSPDGEYLDLTKKFEGEE